MNIDWYPEKFYKTVGTLMFIGSVPIGVFTQSKLWFMFTLLGGPLLKTVWDVQELKEEMNNE